MQTFDAGFDAFYNTIAERLTFHFQKTASWMNWRFRDRPGHPYRCYVSSVSDALDGYVVLKHWQEPNGYRKAHIMDLNAATDVALDQLLAAAESDAADCDEINLWCMKGYPYLEQLERRGFVERESSHQPVIVRALGSAGPASPGRAASFMYGDGDGY